jgi:uncharacterized protein YeaO (DUF488 family)
MSSLKVGAETRLPFGLQKETAASREARDLWQYNKQVCAGIRKETVDDVKQQATFVERYKKNTGIYMHTIMITRCSIFLHASSVSS